MMSAFQFIELDGPKVRIDANPEASRGEGITLHIYGEHGDSTTIVMSRAQAQRIIGALGSCEAAMAERDRIAAGLPTAEEIEEHKAEDEHCPLDYAPPVRE